MARRRSARISQKDQTPKKNATPRVLPHEQLGSLIERDETPTTGPQTNLDAVVSSPVSKPTTPATQPRVSRAEMNPKESHHSTTKAPDSNLKLGFIEVPPPIDSASALAAAQQTPSKTVPRKQLPENVTASGFSFKFASEANLSADAQRLMSDVRVDAERIKASLLQKRKDGEADGIFTGVSATGRKIAKPQGRAGRFSDVHMAEFKKMDSIANHPSSFRAKPNFAQPTQQSLKRSGSKAGLDEVERPRTAGKGTPGRSVPISGRPLSGSSPFKPLPNLPTDDDEVESPKKKRKSNMGEVLAGRNAAAQAPSMPSTMPRMKTGPPASLLTPTKASVAKGGVFNAVSSPEKLPFLSRSNSIQSLKSKVKAIGSQFDQQRAEPPTKPTLNRSPSVKSIRSLPAIPAPTSRNPFASPQKSIEPTEPPASALTLSPSKSGFSTKLPTFHGLKSILRSTRKALNNSPVKDDNAGGTPKRGNTAATFESDSTKKVDFTPSTKSRYAVKLAASSPSVSKLPARQSSSKPIVPYDSSAYTVDHMDSDSNDDEWEDEVDYPVLPTGDEDAMVDSQVKPSSFVEKAKRQSRRESKEFKTIFTTLDHQSPRERPATLTEVNTKVNVRHPGEVTPYAHGKFNRTPASAPKPSKLPTSTIRPVRSSGVSSLVKPFEDTIKTVPHGLPGKKRRRESDKQDSSGKDGRLSTLPSVPGAWNEDYNKENDMDEGQQRGAKRAKVDTKTKIPVFGLESPKKLSKARQQASQHARDRKSLLPGAQKDTPKTKTKTDSARSFLSLSRLNMLSRPKERK